MDGKPVMVETGNNEVVEMYPTVDLRFVERNGESVLQQLFRTKPGFKTHHLWRDVPQTQETLAVPDIPQRK